MREPGVRFGIEFVPNIPFQGLVKLAVLAEESNFAFIWVTDHYNNRNVYVTLTAMALNTKSVYLGSGVTNPYVINPAWTASAIASLDEVSNGRAILGIGSGDRTTLTSLGISIEKPIIRIRESVDIIRSLFKGETVEFDGEVFRLEKARLYYKPTRKIPIYIGAQGPKMLELAGEIGDGILINASRPIDFKYAMEWIQKGIESSGRKLEEVDIAAYTCFSVDPDMEKAKKSAKPVVAFIVTSCPQTILERHGILPADAERVLNAMKKGDFKAAFASVTDSMLDAFSIYGTPSECADRIDELVGIGVTQIIIGSPIGPEKEKAIRLIAEEIIPRFYQAK